MAKIGQLTTAEHTLLTQVRWCDNIWCKFRGLMLRPSLAEGEGLLFAYSGESKMNTTIHMFFMLMPIAVVWLDSSFTVVDTAYAKPWRPAYAPQVPAQYVLEAAPDFLEVVSVGDTLHFEAYA